MRSRQTPEINTVRAIVDFTNGLKEAHAHKVHGGPFCVGEPDVDACIRGQSVKVEVKQPGKDATKLQQAVLSQWRGARAITGVVHSLAEYMELLRAHGLLDS